MKKKLMIAAMLILMNVTPVHAASFFPEIPVTQTGEDADYGTVMGVSPQSEETRGDGSVQRVYENVTQDAFQEYGSYMQEMGCSLSSYEYVGNCLIGTVENGDSSFQISFDWEQESLTIVYPGEASEETMEQISVHYNSIGAGGYHTVGLKTDGTVIATGKNEYGECDVSSWTDIVSLSAGFYYTLGLKSDGTVLATGTNKEGTCNVNGYKNAADICAGARHAVILKNDGTVFASGRNEDGQCDVAGWNGIVAVAAGGRHTVGLKADGTVVAVGSNTDGQCNVGGWSDIVAIAAESSFTIGLKSDGTVVATGSNYSDGEYIGVCDVDNWSDIVAIAVGTCHTVGLKSDGTVVSTGKVGDKACNVYDWSGIVDIFARSFQTFGLKADGTVIAVGSNWKGECNVEGWKNIRHPVEAPAITISGQKSELAAMSVTEPPAITKEAAEISSQPEERDLEREECSECDGLKTCSKCFGEGGRDCTYCIGGRCIACTDGKILVSFDKDGNPKYRDCPDCDYGKCNKCDGKGWVDCKYCVDGECPACHGTGYQ